MFQRPRCVGRKTNRCVGVGKRSIERQTAEADAVLSARVPPREPDLAFGRIRGIDGESCGKEARRHVDSASRDLDSSSFNTGDLPVCSKLGVAMSVLSLPGYPKGQTREPGFAPIDLKLPGARFAIVGWSDADVEVGLASSRRE